MSSRYFKLILFLSLVTASAKASFHEVEVHSTKALLTFSEENSMDIEANYLLYLNSNWQLLFGAEYESYGDLQKRSGIALGGVYNFGAPDHFNKYYVKPQINITQYEANGQSENVTYISAVVGKRFPLFTGSYTINYTPSIGISVPLNNTENFDTIFSVSLVGFSILF
jgi:hypothetical protein